MTPRESALHGRTYAVAIDLEAKGTREDGSEAIEGRILCRRRRALDWLHAHD